MHFHQQKQRVHIVYRNSKNGYSFNRFIKLLSYDMLSGPLERYGVFSVSVAHRTRLSTEKDPCRDEDDQQWDSLYQCWEM